MRVLNDFHCDHCGWSDELLVDNDVKTVACQDCPNVATRVQPMPRASLDPHDAGFPGAWGKWERQREQKRRLETKDSGFDPSD